MKPKPLANSLAVACAIFWVVCALFIWIVPNFSLYLTKTWLMGAQGVIPIGFRLNFGTFLVGGISGVIASWIFGYAWGLLYQKFDKKG